MKVIIDRFEDDIAVCEKDDRTIININKNKLPEGIIEGVVLDIDGDVIFINKHETEMRKEMSKKLLNDLF